MKFSKSHHIDSKPACLQCGLVLDGAAQVGDYPDDRKPREGDLSICVKCSALAVYTGDGIREMTVDERFMAIESPQVQMAIRAIKSMHAKERG